MSTNSGPAHRRPRPSRQTSASIASLSPDLAPADDRFGHFARPLPWIESSSVLELALRTKISPLNLPLPCHGYANGCVCPQCQTRMSAGQRRAPEPKQPWQRAA
jgi:hypothetical protein